MKYSEFITKKSQIDLNDGFEPIWMPDFLFDFQRHLVDWSIRKGRAAIFADCVAGETIVLTADGPQRMDALAHISKPLAVWCRDRNGEPQLAEVSPPWVNGVAPLYQLLFSSGRTLTATKWHRLLSADGWKAVGWLKIGECLLVCDASRLPSISVYGPLARPASGPRCARTVQGSSRRVAADTNRSQPICGLHPSEGQAFEVGRCVASCFSWDTLVAVNYIRTDLFYDLEVPGFFNYFANGLVSHNCGLGKTPMQLVWADNVARKSGKPVIIITPLAVAAQTKREAMKFGIDADVSRDGKVHRITITNYESLHKFNSADFTGGVADESSAIKAFDGRRRKNVVRFFSKLPYRLLCTATPSPNDFIELGTQSECLGIMTQSDMLGFFFRETENMRHTVFREDDFWNKLKYWFKPHSEQPFWRWVSSWSRALRTPEDIGFKDDRFKLPELRINKAVIDVPYIPKGELFARPAIWLHEQREERHRTLNERCEKVTELVKHDRPAITWCHFNEEGILLAKLIPDAVEVAGRHSDEFKEQALNDFATGGFRVLVSKPKIACWGMNYQNCGDMTFFPSFSFEQLYQGIRRCYRFGRTDPVNVSIVSALGESEVTDGLERKKQQAERMFAQLVKYMNDAMHMVSDGTHATATLMPAWLSSADGHLGNGTAVITENPGIYAKPRKQKAQPKPLKKKADTTNSIPLELPPWLNGKAGSNAG